MAWTEDAELHTRRVAAGDEFVFRRYRFVVTRGPDRGAAASCDGMEFTIGTAAGNSFVLTDPTVSRHHVAVVATIHGPLVRDLGSKNGTRLSGFQIESAYLRSGAVLALGETSLRFESLEDDVRLPLSAEDRFGALLGRSAAMRRLFALLPRVAASGSTVLLQGETGTGKGLVAEAIHRASPRAGRPFVVVDCGAIPPTLIESELFGHEKGAFTGAHAARPGAFEAADAGTAFLDEVGELPLDLQPKLLRAIEEREVKRVGAVEPVRLDVRIIAASNRDLRRDVNAGRFRADLFYRLNTVRLRIAPLRERREDVPLLIDHFWAQFAPDDPLPPPDLAEALSQRDWPGNVRELRGAVERVVVFGDADAWRDVPTDPRAVLPGGQVAASADAERGLPFRLAKERAVSRWESSWLGDLIRSHDGNLSRAARAARMDRNHLRELLLKHGVPIREE